MPNWTKEQNEAINEIGKNIIVSAGAGSGKTAVLTERVIKHLNNKVEIDNLLILTFTNAAAAEMKDRIRNKIKENENLKSQLDKIDSAYITTFDAYALNLVKKYSHLLRISKDINIIDNGLVDLKKEEILNKIFDDYYEKEDKLFLKLINDFSLKSDREIFENILTIYDKISNVYDKETYLKNYIENQYSSKNIDKYIDEYLNYVLEKKKDIKKLIKTLSLYVDGSYIQKIEETLNSFMSSNTYKDMKTNIDIRLPNLPRGSEENVKNVKNNLTEEIKSIKNLLKYEDEQEIKTSLYKTKDYSKVITDILLKLIEELDKFKRKHNSYEFIDISNMAIKLLIDNEGVKEELKQNFYEILIDEYQDTNDLQEKFVNLIQNNNVYMVGDIKQSIYRFRNTNPKLFKDKYNAYSKNENGIKIDLNKNFRSRSQVLSAINKMFDKIMDENIGGAQYTNGHQMVYGNLSYENVNDENYDLEILNYRDTTEFSKEEIEIFTIAKDIKNKIDSKYKIMGKDGKPRNIEYQDFAILIDRSTSFSKYKKVFEYLQIPLSMYIDSKITDSKDLLIIKNLYTFILAMYTKTYDKNFKYSYISISRSYLCETKDDEIYQTLQNIKETELYKKCKNISKNLDEMSNYKLIKELITAFNFYEKIIKDGNTYEHLTILDSILKIAQNIDKLGYTPKDFLNYLNSILERKLEIKQKINKGATNSVKIMTIHTSKGLEYPICYYSGLFKEFNISDLKQKFYFEKNYGIITPYIDEYPKTTILKTLLKRHYIKEEISEKIRLFYVALTRAREKMIIVTSVEPKEPSGTIVEDSTRLKYMSFKDMIDSVYDTIEKYVKEVDVSSLNMTKNYNLSKKNFNKEKFLTEKPIEIENINVETEKLEEKHFSKTTNALYTKEEKDNIKMGLHLHEVFENFDFINKDYSKLSDFEKKKVENFINTKVLEGAKKILKEYEFIHEDEDEFHGIIDLLIIKENENVIVDYKLKNTNDKEYLKQLTGYKKYIENITNKHTKIYLYSILDGILKPL